MSVFIAIATTLIHSSTEAATPTASPLRTWVNTAVPDFPNAVEFRAAFLGLRSPQRVELEFGVEPAHSCDGGTVHLIRTPGQTTAVWKWELAKGEAVPLGATIWWRWRVVDLDSSVHVSEIRRALWMDPQFEWRSYTRDELTIRWHGKEPEFGENLVDFLEPQTERIGLIETVRRPTNVFVYENAFDAGPGALLIRDSVNPFRAFNTIVSVIPEESQGDDLTALVHELAHLVVQDRGFNCFTGLPHWLDEGLATFSEGAMSNDMRFAYAQARLAEQFIPLRSLDSPFSSSPQEAALWHAQSYDLIEFLKDVFGWYGVGLLIDAFKDGRTVDEALRSSYSFGVDEIEALWRQHRDLPDPAPKRPNLE